MDAAKLARAAYLGIILVATTTLVCCSRGDLAFTITFQDAKGLVAGDPIVSAGTVIGRVTAIDRARSTVRWPRSSERRASSWRA